MNREDLGWKIEKVKLAPALLLAVLDCSLMIVQTIFSLEAFSAVTSKRTLV
jgi:hypothetical protein